MSQELQRLRNKLSLDQASGWIGGVCAGVARYFNIQPIYVRGCVVIAGVFFWKTVIVAYVVAWLVLYQRKGDSDGGA